MIRELITLLESAQKRLDHHILIGDAPDGGIANVVVARDEVYKAVELARQIEKIRRGR